MWWQGSIAFWTPLRGDEVEIELKRVGYSHDPSKVHPNVLAP